LIQIRLLEERMVADRIEERMAAGHIEDGMVAAHIEKRMVAAHIEERMVVDHIEERMAVDHIEERMAVDHTLVLGLKSETGVAHIARLSHIPARTTPTINSVASHMPYAHGSHNQFCRATPKALEDVQGLQESIAELEMTATIAVNGGGCGGGHNDGATDAGGDMAAHVAAATKELTTRVVAAEDAAMFEAVKTEELAAQLAATKAELAANQTASVAAAAAAAAATTTAAAVEASALTSEHAALRSQNTALLADVVDSNAEISALVTQLTIQESARTAAAAAAESNPNILLDPAAANAEVQRLRIELSISNGERVAYKLRTEELSGSLLAANRGSVVLTAEVSAAHSASTAEHEALQTQLQDALEIARATDHDLHEVRSWFVLFDKGLRWTMPLVPTPACVKRIHV
jgi:hypothetical protein